MYQNLIISIDELWLKGRNRPVYLRAILSHINTVFKSYHPFKYSYKNVAQRFLYESEHEFSLELVSALSRIPGLALISPTVLVPKIQDEDVSSVMEKLYSKIIDEFLLITQKEKREISFRATVKRVDKHFKVSSMEIEKEVGHRVIQANNLTKVVLKKPEFNIDIRIVRDYISFSTVKIKCSGGLPWGTSGNGLCLLSGGFDSPVASYLMNKRGLKHSFVFFHASPFVGNEVLEKIKSLVKVLSTYQKQTHLYIVPFGDIQTAISKSCLEEYRTMLFRKYMVITANKICERIGADALITGDALGQVSSQTLKNIALMDKSSERPIFRPLIGLNKLEVLGLAEHIGTHDISIIPHDDACSLFAPLSPITNPNLDYWNRFDQESDFSELVKTAIDTAEVYSVNSKGDFFKKDFFSFDS